MSLSDDLASARPLSACKPGERGVISFVCRETAGDELERRLLEMGFVEGAKVELLHQGTFGCPIAVRVDDMRVALRRADAKAVKITPQTEAAQ